MTVEVVPHRARTLTPTQLRLCEEYLKDLNAKQAALRAGMPMAWALKHSSSELRKPHIAAHLDLLQKERAARTRISIDLVVRRLLRIATTAEEGNKLPEAIRALELLGKHLAMFTEKVDATFHNPFSSGDTPDAIKRDFDRLMRIAAPLGQKVAQLVPTIKESDAPAHESLEDYDSDMPPPSPPSGSAQPSGEQSVTLTYTVRDAPTRP